MTTSKIHDLFRGRTTLLFDKIGGIHHKFFEDTTC